jgi:hypothetical protein
VLGGGMFPQLKPRPGQAVYVVGGTGPVTSLVNEGLLDEAHKVTLWAPPDSCLP